VVRVYWRRKIAGRDFVGRSAREAARRAVKVDNELVRESANLGLGIARTYPDAVNGIAALRRKLTPDKVLLEKSAWS
jgi:hypothetical protein